MLDHQTRNYSIDIKTNYREQRMTSKRKKKKKKKKNKKRKKKEINKIK